MKLAVFYTEPANITLNSVYEFIAGNFGERVAEKFLDKAEKTIDLICSHPLMFKAVEFNPSVRMGLITPQCSIFYRVTDDAIYLLFFWDNRQKPIF